MYQQPYGPWAYGQGPPPVQYVPVPPGTDVERLFKLLERLEKRDAKRKEADKKKEDEKKKPKPQEAPQVNIVVVFLLMMTLGLPVGYVNLWLAQTVAESIKLLLK